MKKFILASLVVASLFAATGCEEKKNSVEYNNELMRVINDNEKHIDDMNTAMQSKDYATASKVQETWVKAIDQDIQKITDMGDFNGDTKLQKAVLTGLKGYKKIASDDYPKLIEIRKNNVDEASTEKQLLDNINDALEGMANGINEAADKFEKDDAK